MKAKREHWLIPAPVKVTASARLIVRPWCTAQSAKKLTSEQKTQSPENKYGTGFGCAACLRMQFEMQWQPNGKTSGAKPTLVLSRTQAAV